MALSQSEIRRIRHEMESDGQKWAEAAPAMASEEEKVVDADGIDVPALLVVPQAIDNETPHIFVHGGAWISGSSKASLGLIRRIADCCRRPVLSLDYPLAPENPYPAAIDALSGACRALSKHTGLAGLIGCSAGGHLALAAAMRLRDEGLRHVPSAIQLWCPALSLIDAGASRSVFGSGFGLTAQFLREAAAAYAVSDTDRDFDLPAADMQKLPTTMIACGAEDPLLDDSVRMYLRLRECHTPARLEIVPDVQHGFMNRWSECRRSDIALLDGLIWLERQCKKAAV